MNKILDLWQKDEYLKMKPGLERIKGFLRDVGNPHNDIKCIHIAGTNGKGSTARILSEILTSSGYKTGLFTSPHLIKVNERIQINNNNITDKTLDYLTSKHLSSGKKHNLTYFEFITGIAYLYFAAQKVDITILETGLGGRFDATNVISKSLVSIITDINYDHQEVLGNSILQIAKEKFGIVKNNSFVVSGILQKNIISNLRDICKNKSCNLFEYKKDFNYKFISINWSKIFQKLKYNGISKKLFINCNLLGHHQSKNISIALAAAEILEKMGFKIHFKQNLNLNWPGRFDIKRLKENKTVIMDGAHNLSAIESLVDTIKQTPLKNKVFSIVFGTLRKLQYKMIIKKLNKIANKVVLIQMDSKRAVPVNKLRKEWLKYTGFSNINVVNSQKEALEILQKEKNILVTGSLYMMGDFTKYLNNLKGN